MVEKYVDLMNELNVTGQEKFQQFSEMEDSEQSEEDSSQRSVAKMLEEQNILGLRYEDLLRQKKQITTENVLQAIEEESQRKEELAEIQQKLKENTKFLCSNLKETHNEYSNWVKLQKDRDELISFFNTLLRELDSGLNTKMVNNQQQPKKNVMTFQNEKKKNDGPQKKEKDTIPVEIFTRKVEEQMKEKEILNEITEKEKETSNAVKELQNEVKKVRNQREQELAKKQLEISEKINKIRMNKAITKKETIIRKATSEGDLEREERVLLNKEKDLQKDEEIAKTNLLIEVVAHKEIVKCLEKKITHFKGVHQHWEKTLEEKKNEYENVLQTITKQLESLQVQLVDTKRRHFELKELRDRKLEEEKRKAEQKRKQYYNTVHAAATAIKLAYKSYKARQLYAERLTELEKNKKKATKKEKKKK